MGSLILPFLVAGILNIIIGRLVWKIDDDAAWQRRERRLRAEGIAPLRPDNWSKLHRQQKVAFIVGMVVFSIFIVVIAFGGPGR